MASAESNRNPRNPGIGICRRLLPFALAGLITFACNFSAQPTQDIEVLVRVGIALTQDKQTQIARSEAEPQAAAENPPALTSTPTARAEEPAPAEVQYYSADANIVWEESGSLNSRDAGIDQAVNDVLAGMTARGDVSQAFMSFNISHIPADATILTVTPQFFSFFVDGDPFSISPFFLFWYPYSDIGDLNFADDFWYGMDPEETLAGWENLSALENPVEIPSLVPLVQEAVRGGADRMRIRAHFAPDAPLIDATAFLIFAPQGSESSSVPMQFSIEYSISA